MKQFFFLIFVAVSFANCAERATPFHIYDKINDTVDTITDNSKDSVSTDTKSEIESDKDTQPVKDTESETNKTDSESEVLIDTDSDSESTVDDTSSKDTSSDSSVEPGELGDKCWIPVLPSNHPNAGLPGCIEGLRCVGDNYGAWCTTTCLETGSKAIETKIKGWCCGEIGSECNPTKYYLPESMSSNCVPRILEFGQPCELDGEARCKPVCDGTSIVYSAHCIQVDENTRFCSHRCVYNTDCVGEEAFANGCCGTVMGSQLFCITSLSDRCIQP